MLSLKDYVGREQSFLKHTILETYLQRLFMIIGRAEVIINYVDCFAGPWADDNKELKDTSIGLSIEQMRKCVATLRKTTKGQSSSEHYTLKRTGTLLQG